MAFDQAVEADRRAPGEMNFLVSFVTAPVVGILWLLGGRLQDGNHSDGGGGLRLKQEGHAPDGVRRRECGAGTAVTDDSGSASALRRKSAGGLDAGRTMSWSDESGGKLAVIFDLAITPVRSAPPAPARSAIRSPSFSSFSAPPDTGGRRCSDPAPPTSRPQHKAAYCFPRDDGIGSTRGGPRAGGGVSPQWGWYISTTPPQAAVYASARMGAGILRGGRFSSGLTEIRRAAAPAPPEVDGSGTDSPPTDMHAGVTPPRPELRYAGNTPPRPEMYAAGQGDATGDAAGEKWKLHPTPARPEFGTFKMPSRRGPAGRRKIFPTGGAAPATHVFTTGMKGGAAVGCNLSGVPSLPL